MSEDGLVVAYLLDGKGSGREIGWKEIAEWSPENGVLWVHLDITRAGGRAWVIEQSGLDELEAEALLEDETRPRSTVFDNGLLVILRGVNLNPGADPEDMVSIRLWVEKQRVISLRRRRLLSVDDLRKNIGRGLGPRSPADLLVDMADRLVARAADVVDGIDESVDELQEQVVTGETRALRSALADLRREAIALRRYLAPQREAMNRLSVERNPWLGDAERLRLREEADRVTRYVEDLDAARERAGVTQEELNSRLSEQMNNRMYILSLIAGIFLPISFVTGLLGVNVGGIPAAEKPWGFLVVSLLLIVIVALQVALFKRKHWL